VRALLASFTVALIVQHHDAQIGRALRGDRRQAA
jgi:hypothetical protein